METTLIIIVAVIFCWVNYKVFQTKKREMEKKLLYYNNKLNFEQKEREKLVGDLIRISEKSYPEQILWMKDVPNFLLKSWLNNLRKSNPDALFPAKIIERELKRRNQVVNI